MQLTDTHCHIHEAMYTKVLNTETRHKFEKAGSPSPDEMIASAQSDSVTRIVCVGTTLQDSEIAVDFVSTRDTVWASIGLHPHEAKDYAGNATALKQFAALAGQHKVIAVGECGLDYYRTHSPKSDQQTILRFQIELALRHNLPMIFHVRDAFSDFWSIFDEYKGIRGIIHSFTATRKELDQILARDLYVGLNGIMTFTNQKEQLEAAKAVPLAKMVLETDAPFLTPAPYRGNICEPKHIRVTAEFLAELREESVEQIAQMTTANAIRVLGLR